MIDLLLDLLYPPLCEHCFSLIARRSQLLCIKCILALPRTDYHRATLNPVAQHFWGRLDIEKATAFLHFNKESITQKLIHKLKYEDKAEIGFLLGSLAAQELDEDGFFNDIDLIIPVPMHAKKQKKRGYNQADSISKGVSHQTNIPISRDLLIKRQHTETQTKKSRTMRFSNVENSFTVNNSLQNDPRHILLIDDVITTGSTLEACGRKLKDTLNCRLSVLTLAATD